MKHALPGIALLAALGCAGDAEIPALELGGPGGARLMNGQARTPFEAYEFAYSSLHRQHYNIARNLEARGQSVYAARAAVDAVVSALESMRSLVGPSDRSRFDPYLARYRAWSADLAANRWGGSFLQDVERSEYELKDKFHPSNVEIIADFAAPGAAAPAPAPASAPKGATPPGPSTPGVPDDKVVAPPRLEPSPSPAPPPAATPAPVPAPGTSNPAAARLFFKAWDRSHDDLLATYKAKKDCRAAYEDVVGALRQLQASVPAEKRPKLQIYLDYYGGVHDKTKGFSALPAGEKITEKDIVDELDVAARVIRKEFNPDK